MAGSAFDGLEPALIWRHFAALTEIPRCSGNEAAVAAHIERWATGLGLEASRDGVGNLRIRVPARGAPDDASRTVVLQGHLDMVGEKDSSSAHDFDRDPIAVERQGDWLTARGTTLGADNGIGVAAAMALAEDPGVVHGPLELLFTIDEETGLTGAQGLERGWLEGRVLLNLDSEEEGALYVGCAGGVDTEIYLPLERGAAAGDGLVPHLLRIHGLHGGHSGLDINAGRGNALVLCARLLRRLREVASRLELVELSAGDKHNAIPREAIATLLLPPEDTANATKLIETFRAELAAIYERSDPGIAVELTRPEQASPALGPLTPAARDRLLDLLIALPHGVLAMSQAVDGLVETSTNLAVLRLEAERAVIRQSSRSSVAPAVEGVKAQLAAVARLAGAVAEHQGQYPGWAPNPDSPLLKKAQAVHERVLGGAPAIKAIHAGLECGIIGERNDGMDMLSFGPHIESPHSPSERIKIASVGPFYAFLAALAAELAG